MKWSFLIAGCLMLAPATKARTLAPAPYGPVPSERQMAWHRMEMYAFIHFTTTTFRDVEWGYGDASPDEFCPDSLDCTGWVATLKAAGMRGVILTAKHHDGFCLWPSRLTDYSVAQSSWRGGQGDVVRELSDAAHRQGLKFGVYLSPWDRHDMRYGSAAYIDYYRGQLQELLTGYGPVFEVWQDGANGGDGYYGGARERRKIDNRTYYDWPETNRLIRQWQPDACIFSDGGPDVRWCGTESGHVGETNWCAITRANYGPRHADLNLLQHGEENGTDWVPAEVDVSIRPGWFYHAAEDGRVKSPEELMDIYYSSVGRGSNLILNIPPTKSGRLHPTDLHNLLAFGRALKQEFSKPLRRKIKHISSSQTRGGSKQFSPKNAFDGKKTTYWATDDSVCQASLMFKFKEPTAFNRFSISEHLPLGQRVKAFRLEIQTREGQWKKIAEGTTIGYKRLLRFPTVQARQARVVIANSRACPCIENIEVYYSPNEMADASR